MEPLKRKNGPIFWGSEREEMKRGKSQGGRGHWLGCLLH